MKLGVGQNEEEDVWALLLPNCSCAAEIDADCLLV